MVQKPGTLRSQAWFNNPEHASLTALYLERYLNFGLPLDELQPGRPIIGLAQTGSDLSPCNRHHLTLAEGVRARPRRCNTLCRLRRAARREPRTHILKPNAELRRI